MIVTTKSDFEIVPSGTDFAARDPLWRTPDQMSTVFERNSSGAGFPRDSGTESELASATPPGLGGSQWRASPHGVDPNFDPRLGRVPSDFEAPRSTADGTAQAALHGTANWREHS